MCFGSFVQVLEQAWPFFGMYMEKLLKESIQPAVRQSSPALKTFNFTKIHFGHVVSLHFVLSLHLFALEIFSCLLLMFDKVKHTALNCEMKPWRVCVWETNCWVSHGRWLRKFFWNASLLAASQDHWNEGVHTWGGSEGGDSGHEHMVGYTQFLRQSCFELVKCV